MITRISAVAAVMLLASPMAFAATSGSTTSPQSGAVTNGPGTTDQMATQGTAPGTMTHQKQAKRGSFAALDTNHDGVVDKQEWKAAGRKDTAFNRIDADHDGSITTAEMQSYRAAHAHNSAKHTQKSSSSTTTPSTMGTTQQ